LTWLFHALIIINHWIKANKMCGRFSLFCSPTELQRHFDVHPAFLEIPPNYNVAPTQEVPVIIRHKGGRHLEKHHWGLVPFWAKDASIGSRMINARVETITSKPAFRVAIKQRRCLIPANGFYEWFGKSGNKQPYYFCLPSNKPIAFAGLWEVWEDKNTAAEASPYKSCTIITTDASESVKDIHNRMPRSSNPSPMPNGLILKTRNLKESRRS
jgi:putative SOS response-associated peptidase YedK